MEKKSGFHRIFDDKIVYEVVTAIAEVRVNMYIINDLPYICISTGNRQQKMIRIYTECRKETVKIDIARYFLMLCAYTWNGGNASKCAVHRLKKLVGMFPQLFLLAGELAAPELTGGKNE